MLSSTFELITMVASNSLLVFLICNIIIVILFVASSLQSSQVSENKPYPQFDDSHSHSHNITDKANASSLTTTSIDKAQKSGGQSESLSVKIDEENIDVKTSRSISVEERTTENEDYQWKMEVDDEEDELQRRAEEFINKLKQHWMEEKFGKSVV